jgi:hypothetical protein
MLRERTYAFAQREIAAITEVHDALISFLSVTEQALVFSLRVAEALKASRCSCGTYRTGQRGRGRPSMGTHGIWAQLFHECLATVMDSFSEEELRPYFPLEGVCNGLFTLAERLFGVTVTQAPKELEVRPLTLILQQLTLAYVCVSLHRVWSMRYGMRMSASST